MRHRREDAGLIADLNDLLQLDHDAVEAYTVAIDLARDKGLRDALVRIRAEHKDRIEEIASLVRELGGLPLEIPHVTAGLKIAVQTAGSVAGDTALLLAFKAVEGQVAEKFRKAMRGDLPEEAGEAVRKAAAIEAQHEQWVENELERHGVGAGTMPHNAAAALEEIHKILANPIERVSRDVKEQVGEILGTRHSRGGSDAPSPAAAARGAAQAMSDSASAAPGTGPSTTGGAAMNRESTASTHKHDVEQFIQALHELEHENRLDAIVQLFDPSAEISNAIQPEPRRGQEGAREFWRVYRDSFKDIHSDFQTVVEQDGKAVLEWTSRGHKASGEEVTYSGVSVLELEQGKVRRFRAYFDPQSLVERARE